MHPNPWLTCDAEDAEIIATLERWYAWMYPQGGTPSSALQLHLGANEWVVSDQGNHILHRAPLPLSLHALTQWWRDHHPLPPTQYMLHTGIRLDPAHRLVDYGTHRLELTEKECELLVALHQAGEDGITKDALLHTVWGYHPDVETHTLDTHLYRLRQKLAESPATPHIEIIVAQGTYRIHLEAS
jgi:Transcriptional regulatory protein, C terminal